jgi:hypothetical protein
MTPEMFNQFWWNWWVQLAVASGTLLAVVAALFGEKLKSWWFSPDLHLELANPNGSKTIQDIQSNPPQRLPSRWYHLRVSNKKKWPLAHGVQVYLTRIEEPGPGDEYEVSWLGEVPLRWMHQEVQPIARVVGPSYPCDFCSITKDDGLSLWPLIQPNNYQWNSLQGRRRMKLHVEARAEERVSKTYVYEILWDGQWEDGDAEMAKHFKIREAPL